MRNVWLTLVSRSIYKGKKLLVVMRRARGIKTVQTTITNCELYFNLRKRPLGGTSGLFITQKVVKFER